MPDSSRFLRYACLALALAAPAAYAAQDCDVDGVSVNPSVPHTLAGKTGAMRCIDHDTRQLLREQEVIDGELMGTVKRYKDGKLVAEYRINEEGNRDGRSRVYWPSGQLLRDETYNDGLTVGIARSFYADGKPKRITSYTGDGSRQAYVQYGEDGRLYDLRCAPTPVFGGIVPDAALCGHMGKQSVVDLFLSDDTLRARVTYLAGKRLRFQTFWPNGQLATDVGMGDGTRSELLYSDTGVKLQDEQWVRVDGELVESSELIFHDNGTLTSERRWNKGQLLSEKAFYANGQPRRVMQYSDEGGNQLVAVEEYFDDGKLATQGSYLVTKRQGRVPVGVHVQYDEVGHLRAEAEYDMHGRMRRSRQWSATGTLVRSENMRRGSAQLQLKPASPADAAHRQGAS